MAAEKSNGGVAVEQQQTQQPVQTQAQRFVCTGDCKKCSARQWEFCASIHAYSNMMVLDKVMEVLGQVQHDMAAMQGSVTELTARIEAIQNSEADVFDPTAVTDGDLFKDTAQEEDGAENRSSYK